MNHNNRHQIDLFDRSYHIRSDLDASKIEAIFQRLQQEVRRIEKQETGLSNQEALVLTALNLTEQLFAAEAENKYLTDLLDHNGYTESESPY